MMLKRGLNMVLFPKCFDMIVWKKIFIHSFIHSIIHSFIYLLTYSFFWFIYSLADSFICSLMYLFKHTKSCININIHYVSAYLHGDSWSKRILAPVWDCKIGWPFNKLVGLAVRGVQSFWDIIYVYWPCHNTGSQWIWHFFPIWLLMQVKLALLSVHWFTVDNEDA